MKTSLRKLRGFALHRHGGRRDLQSLSQLDELAQASQVLDDMRNCYDRLLAAAAATTNTAYEFSESVGELGSSLLEKTALNEDEESGKVLLMLGKGQLELQKMLDCYRSHLSRTITVPCQSLLNELQTVEEMKQQCDEKRRVYEYMIMKQREKGKSRSGKGESFSMQQLQEAREQYEEEATLFVFRLKSLKQGQSRSLLTQAARHHAAQLHLFRRALKSVEAVDPHVKLVAKQLHIDYQLNGLEDDDTDTVEDDDDDDDNGDVDDGTDSYNTNDDGSSTENFGRSPGNLFASSSGDMKSYTQSAPLSSSDRRADLLDRTAPLRQCSSRKLQTYVLPTPGDQKGCSVFPNKVNPLPSSMTTSSQKISHSSPLEPKKQHVNLLSPQAVLRESNSNKNTAISSTLLLPPGLLNRQAFSEPLNNNPQSNQHFRLERSRVYSEPLLRNTVCPPPSSSPKASPLYSSSLSRTSSLKISELHELPRPPVTTFTQRPSGFVGHSAPLAASRITSTASPLPTPPTVLPRSFSIPSSSGSSLILPQALEDSPGGQEMADRVSSPPLTPMSFSNIRIVPSDSSH